MPPRPGGVAMAAMVSVAKRGVMRESLPRRGCAIIAAMPAAPDQAPLRDVRPAGIAVLALVALSGNGLKALVTSSVLVSEGTFAAFLHMRPEQVAALMEATIAGMVVALALCPLLMHRLSARRLGLAACGVACAAFM